jgi:PPP family 3-phenylpropionic acid transporter
VAGWLWALGVVCEIGIFWSCPEGVRPRQRRNRVAGTLVIAAVRFLLIGWQADNLPVLLFAQLLHAFTFGAYHASALALVHRHFTGRNQARGQALYNSLAFGVGGTLGSLYSGAAWDVLGAGDDLQPGRRIRGAGSTHLCLARSGVPRMIPTPRFGTLASFHG